MISLKWETTQQIYHTCSSKQLFLIKHPEKKIQVNTSISTYNVNSEEMDVTSLSGRINGVNIIKEFQTGAVGRIEGVAVVTGICYMKMFWRFAGTKKVAVITRWS